ncbi:MAG: HAMP domain-containing histidine kinase [Verrucomicrobia bacterium]|nr:HAMP domain-containing histidine kinase [Verrucomicrobiota bacterium]
MMTGKGTPPVAGKQQRFLWRGLLIVLPALAMAGFGFVSLRQDRLLVRHQAAEQAEKIVAELVQHVLPAAFTLDLRMPGPPAPSIFAPQDDPVLGAAIDGIIAMLLDDAGQLAFPLPPRWPMPEPLELDRLDSDQLHLWTAARHELFAGGDPTSAMSQFEALLERQPPERFEALARFHLFELALRAGQRDRTTDQLDEIRRKFGRVKTESGLPLRLLAEWRALRLVDARSAPPAEFEQHLDWLCAQAVLDPGPVSESILEWVGQFGNEALQAGIASESIPPWPPPAGSWMRLHNMVYAWTNYWDAHQQARGLFELLRGTWFDLPADDRRAESGWVKFNSRDFLILRQPAANGTWWLAWPEEALRTQVQRALHAVSIPAEFACGIEVGGRRMTSSGPAETRLASRTVPLRSPTTPELTATIWLFDPDTLYARQRKRTWWFGSLIAVSVVSVLGGATAAWRGFSEQQRLTELKSNFVSSVSHEMRAPIASVRLMAEELVDRGPSDPAKAGEYHGYILQECRRLSALIENVLDFSRHEQGRKQYRFEPVDLGRVVEETMHVMRSYAADRKVTLEHRVEGAPFELVLDAAAIQQVLVNLVDNAIKHSPAGAAVEVALAYPDPAPASIPAGQSNGTPPVRLTVRDQGPGIPEAEQRLIFQRFYRRGTELRRETQGIGLGLAIVQYIAEAHGGSVRVESQPGNGSRFIVELPVAGRDQS